jgi:hypothetical protein
MPLRTDVVPPEVIELLIKSSGILKKVSGAYLAGGTALAMHLSHRVSIDLDFFTPVGFLAEEFRSELSRAGSFTPITVRNDTVVCRIDQVQWSLFKYEYPLVDAPQEYSGIQVASLRDIAAMKVVAIGDRGSRKDFYDLYAILNRTDLGMAQILKDVGTKYSIPEDNLYHYIRAFTYFEDAMKSPDIQSLLRMSIQWPEVEDFFRKMAKRLIP